MSPDADGLAAIHPAAHRKLTDEFGSLAAFFWQYEPDSQPKFDGCRSMTPESKALSKELKRRGWSFVGPTTCYAFMQAMGMVNDHLPGCQAYGSVANRRRRFQPPGNGRA